MADLDSPYQDVVKEEFSPQPTEIRKMGDGTRTGVFSFEDIAPGTCTVLTQKYTVRLDGSNWLNNGGGEILIDPRAYLGPAAKIECADPRIQAVALRINPNGDIDDLGVAQKAFEFTRSTLTYNSYSPSANQGALAGLQAGSGCCEEYASLFVAVCRASGIPARIVNGYANDRDELAEDETLINMTGRRHQWAEFYLDGKGWIPVDPTLSIDMRPVFGQLPTGCYVAENYGDRQVTGKYRGGKLAIQFQDQVARGY
ncbi:MAG: transglutaminase-like domain-containing protein [Syntrophomonadaceae bacterium]